MSSIRQQSPAPILILESLSRGLAVLGGLVLVALAIMTVVSVTGRFLFGSAITGDFEMVETGCAIAVSLFLPYSQMRTGHVIVDFVTMNASHKTKHFLDFVGCVIIAVAAALLAWRLSLGAYDLFRYNDQTMVLQMPTWIPYVIVVPCFALLSLTGLVTAWRHIKELSAGEPDLNEHSGEF